MNKNERQITFLLVLCFLIFSRHTNAQEIKMFSMGNVSLEELNMKSYTDQPNAKTIILAEQSVKKITIESTLTTEIIYRKIKFFSKKETGEATISFKVPNLLDIDQALNTIKGVTYNLEGNEIHKSYLKKEDVFVSKGTDGLTKITFTMPTVKEGSVIEYEYLDYAIGIQSIDHWTFQSDIPKKTSRVIFMIPTKFKYKTYLIGNLKLSNSSVFESEKCRYNKGSRRKCNIAFYQIDNIPSLEFEEYTSSPINYLSRISLQFNRTSFMNGISYTYYNTWESFDKVLKKSDVIGKRIRHKSYFKRNLPEEIKSIKDTLLKAKKIYYYIQNHYSVNNTSEKHKIISDFRNKYGSSLNINLALLNSLNSQGIISQLVLLSTRDHGMINKKFPEDFTYNYSVVKTTISHKEYFLDAADKFCPFGTPPFKTLNGEGRVFNFKGDNF